MSLDFLAIADGLATRYTAANVTPPTGYRNISLATARLPNGIENTPAVLVFLEDGNAIWNAERDGEHRFRVRFLYDRSSGDLPKDTKAILAWLGVLWDATHAAVKLGLGSSNVDKARETTYELGDFEYGGTAFYGFDIIVTVDTSDPMSLTP